ncbi:hypothetical protein [uncultured Paenibacillus sp.]|uniref:hypothetical protein n=1 Tax=uncultured Paenibacillus sp. TaxID=227322 RepID=UPI0015A9960B|nr:hypothetical protein [uncultured Paenibacillus sp.]
MVRIERQPELRKLRAEEREAFDTLVPGVDKTSLPGFMEWEDKHLFRRAAEHECLYLQGVKDGAQLVIALLGDSVPEK